MTALSGSLFLVIGSPLAWAEDGDNQPAAPTAMTTPAMNGPLAANPNPTSLDAGPFGPVYMTGAISGLGLWQNNISPGDQHSLASLSNGQFFFQKPDGVLQYFVEVGAYTLPSLGTPYVNTHEATGDYFGPLPVAYLSLAPSSTFSIEAGKLPTLIGAGYTFSFQNPNIEHSLLWNQEPAINRGGQLNYTTGPLALSFSWNDGFYSNRYTWLTGSTTYTLDNANRFALAAGGNYSHTAKSTLATPLFQNNETILDLVYIHIAKPWAFATGFQYTHVPAILSIGALTSASTAGGGVLLNYSFGDGSPLAGVSLPVRLEYISSTGSLANGAPNLLYGPGSNAWSITVTPTYQYNIFFARVEFSRVGATSTTPGLAFGPAGTNTTQTRGVFEFGILF
jgi:Putative beta-barrel porin-2, OmpL-like. bbp2